MHKRGAGRDIVLGIVIGVAYIATPGPVNIETIRRGVMGGFRVALAIQLGALIGDLTYALVALAGLARALTHPATIVLLLLVAMLLLAFPLPAPVFAADAATIDLSPTAGPPTTQLSIKGKGYMAGEAIDLLFDDSRLGTTQANRVGNFAAQVSILASALPGNDRFDGELVMLLNAAYERKNAQDVQGANLAIMRSQDKGANWSAPIFFDKLSVLAAIDPLTGQPVRNGRFIPDIAVDPTSDALYAVWHDGRFSGSQYNDIAFSMSADGGLS
jgi:hypothetical protein